MFAFSGRSSRPRCLAVVLGVTAFLGRAAAQTYEYVGGTGSFTTGTNWASGTAPTGYGTIAFRGPGGTATNDLVSLVSGLAFSGSATGSYIVAGNGMSVGAGGVASDSSFAQTIQVPLTLTASATVSTNAASLTLSGSLDNGGFGVTVAGAADTTIASLSGAGGLVKSGTGTLTLSGSNSSTGGTTIVAGRILAASSSALGSFNNPLAVNGGTLNTGTFSLSIGALSGSTGAIITTATNFGTRTLSTTVATGSSSVFGGAIQNSGSGVMALTKLGGGMLVISGSNSNTGTTTIAAGTLAVGTGGTSGRLGSGSIVNNGALSFNRGDTYGGPVSNLISGSGSVTLAGGTLTLTGTNSFTGGTTIQAGTLLLGHAQAIGGTANALMINGGTLNVQTFSPSIGALSGSGGTITTVSTAGTRTLSTMVFSGSTSVFAGSIQNSGSGVMALTKLGAGTLVLSGSNAYSGTTSIAGGTLLAGGPAALGIGPVNITSGTLDTGSVDLAVGAVAGSAGAVVTTAATLGTRTLTTTVASGSTTFAGGLRDNGSGRLGLAKLGSGTLMLSGSSNLTGGVTINAGTILAGHTFALGGAANAVAVNGGALNTGTFSLSIGALSGSSGGVVTTATTAGTRTLTTNVTSGTSVFAGSIQNSGSGIMALTKAGNGTLVLSGSNAYTGLTTITGGTLQVGDGGTTGSLAGDFAMTSNATIVFNRSDDITLTGWGGNAGTFVKDGAGTLTLAGSLFLPYDGMGPMPAVIVAEGTLQIGDGGTALGLAPYIPITNNGTVAFNSSASTSFTAPISGSGSLVKRGLNSLALSGSNSYTGGTTLAGGTVRVGNTFALGGTSSALTINAGTLDTGTFSLSIGALSGSSGGIVTTATTAGTRTLTTNVASGSSGFAGSIQNSGSGIMALTKAGNGTLVLSGSNAYTGLTTITGGTLQVGDGGTNGTLGVGSVTNNAALVFDRSDDYGGAYDGSISGSGRLAVVGGVLTLTGSSSVAGGTMISDGTLRIGSGGTSGRLVSGTVTNNGAIVFNRSDSYGGAVASVITGTGSIAVSGGSLTLTAASPFTGATSVDGGTLTVQGSLAGSVAVNAGGTLAGPGAVGAVTVNSGATLAPGSGIGTLSAGSVIFGAGGNYNWQIGSTNGTAGSQWDFIDSSGVLTVAATAGSPFAINLWTLSGTVPATSGSATGFNQYANGSWKIGTFAGGITGFDSTLFSLVTGSANGTDGFANEFTGTFSLAAVGNDLRIMYTAPIQSSYDYSGGTGSFSDPANWSLETIPAGTPAITFSGAGGTATNDLLSAVTGLTFTGSAAGAYTVTGSTLGIGFGGVVNDSAFTQTIESPLVLSTAAAVTAGGGDLVLSGGVDTSGSALTVDGAADTTIASLTGGGGIAKSGAGVLTLSGSSSFSGGTTIAAGRVVAGDASALGAPSGSLAISGGTLDTGTSSLSVGSLSGAAGAVITTAPDAGTRTLSTLVSAGTLTYAGSLRDNGVGLLGLAKSGSGTLVLSGSSAYTGGTVISGGTLAVGNGAALGGSANAMAVNAGTLDVGTFNVTVGALSGSAGGVVTTAATAGTRTLTATVAGATSTYAGSLRDNGVGKLALVKSGTGTLLLSGSNAATGGLTVAAGTLQIGNAAAASGTTNALAVTGGTLSTGTFNISVGSLSGSAGGVITTATTAGTRTLTTNVASGSSVFAGTLQNNGSGVMALTKTGAGTLVLTGSNGASGATTISAGTLQVGAGGTSGSLGGGMISNNGALVFNRTDDYGGPLANVVTGTGRLTVTRGSLTLAASSSFTGDTRVVAGSLTLSATRGLALSTLDMNAADVGSVVFSSTGAQTFFVGGLKGSRNLDIGANTLSVGGNNQATTYAGGLSGEGGLVKAGTGLLTLSGSSSYAGGTTISGGTLQVGGGGTTGALGAGGVVNNATLAFNRSDNYGGAFTRTISGSGGIRLVSGSLALAADNSYTGATTISAGTLQIGAGGAAGALGGGAVTNNGALVFNRTDDYGGPWGNAITGTGSLTLVRGSLTITGSSGSTGPTTIAGGALQVGNGGTAGRLGGGAITNNGSIVFNRTDGYGGSIANVISGSGSLTLAGGTLALVAVNSFSGTTRVAGGVLSLGNTQALARSTLDLYSTDSGVVSLAAGTSALTYTLGGLSGSRNLAIGGNTLAIGNNNASSTYAGSISGSGGLVKIGTGTFTMTGSNSYTGPTTVYSGRLIGNTTSLSGTIANYAMVEFAQVNDGTFGGRVSTTTMAVAGTVKSGAGTLTLSGTWSGNRVTVSGGRLVTGASNLPNVALVADAAVEFAQSTSGTLFGSLSGSGAVVKSGSGTLTLQSGGFIGTTTVSGGRLVASASTLRGPIVTNAAVEFAQTANGEYTSLLSGTGLLFKSGAGTLTLSGSSLVTGLTTISGGMLATGGAERLADTSTLNISGGASLRLGGNETIGALLGSGSVNLQSYQLTIAGSGSSSYAGSIFGSGGLTKAGSGILTLSGSNGFLGATNLNAGTLLLSSSTALSPFTTLSIAAGSTLVVNRDVRVFAYTNSGGTISGTGRLLTSATAATSGTLTSLSNVSGTDSYAVGLLKTSTATLVVSGSTSFTGGVVVEQGTVKLDAGGSFAASNVVDVRSGATLDLNGQSQTVSALAGSGSVALGGGTLTVDAATSTTFAGAIDGGALVKSGSSALNLTGSTAVSTAAVTSGLMSVNGMLSGTVTVAPGGTLGGAGTIIGNVTVGGTHAPGNSPDVSTIAGNLSYDAGATVVWEIGANTATQGPAGSRAFDQIVVGGNLTFSGSTALVLSFYDQDPNSSWASTVDWTDAFWSENRAWTLWQVSGATDGFTNLNLLTESWLDSNGAAFGTILPDASFSLALSGNDVTLVYAVPEPSTLVLAAAAAGIGFLATRRRSGAAKVSSL